ncbi:hypothetical protein [Microlunatus antarcticus]|uniref:Uncharacterized protein n=1 Tax=Microlunatus antarcticus TaxID=53388 RepID=A0A7W5JVW8_9ACTN|nr:hypothetical protein [Microlunatus antarcticus]MBB3327228.1 hypothetical protein [Microlunatus antarcticus]
MSHSSLPPTTHTLEMAQVAELDGRLADHASAPVTAADLGMTEAPLRGARSVGLAADAVLVHVSWRGSPEFPDVYGHFGHAPRGQLQALLHTAALELLARRLGVRQRWGVEPPPKNHVAP